MSEYADPVTANSGITGEKLTKQDIFALARDIQSEAVTRGKEKPLWSEACHEARRRLTRRHGEAAVRGCFENTGDKPLTFREKD